MFAGLRSILGFPFFTNFFKNLNPSCYFTKPNRASCILTKLRILSIVKLVFANSIKRDKGLNKASPKQKQDISLHVGIIISSHNPTYHSTFSKGVKRFDMMTPYTEHNVNSILSL